MVKVKAIKDFFDMDKMEHVEIDDIFEVSEKRFKQLIDKGVVVKASNKTKKETLVE